MPDPEYPDELKRSRSDAMHTSPSAQRRKMSDETLSRGRSRSGDSATLVKHFSTGATSRQEGEGPGAGQRREGEEEGAVAAGGVTVVVGGSPGRRTAPALRTNGQHFKPRENGHADIADLHKTLHAPAAGSLVRSRSSEDISLTSYHRLSGSHAPSQSPPPRPRATCVTLDQEFCELNYAEPEDLDTGEDYTLVFDESEEELSGSEEDIEDKSEEVKDLTPFDSGGMAAGKVGEGLQTKGTTSVLPPRATNVLINVFRQRLESVLINSVDYPPGLFFVL